MRPREPLREGDQLLPGRLRLPTLTQPHRGRQQFVPPLIVLVHAHILAAARPLVHDTDTVTTWRNTPVVDRLPRLRSHVPESPTPVHLKWFDTSQDVGGGAGHPARAGGRHVLRTLGGGRNARTDRSAFRNGDTFTGGPRL